MHNDENVRWIDFSFEKNDKMDVLESVPAGLKRKDANRALKIWFHDAQQQRELFSQIAAKNHLDKNT